MTQKIPKMYKIDLCYRNVTSIRYMDLKGIRHCLLDLLPQRREIKKKSMLKFLAYIRTDANKLFSLQINELDFLSIDKRKEQYNSLLLFN